MESFQCEASCFLEESSNDVQRLTDLLEQGQSLDIDLPELTSIKQVLNAFFHIPVSHVPCLMSSKAFFNSCRDSWTT